MNIKGYFLVPALIALSGCASYWSADSGKLDPADFGEANRQTYAAMIVDPDPQYDEPLATSADRAAQAVEAYREGAVEAVEAPDLQSVGSGNN